MRIYLNRAVVIGVLAGLSACAGSGKAVIEPTTPSTSTPQSSAYREQLDVPKKVLDAIKALERQVIATPGDINANLELAAILRQVERFDEAKKYLTQAQGMSRDAPQVLNEVAILQRTQGQFTQAEKTYLKILANSPDYFDAHFNLGILYDLYLRQPAKAQAQYRAYVNSAPDADPRVEKWLLDLERRFQSDTQANRSAVNTTSQGEAND